MLLGSGTFICNNVPFRHGRILTPPDVEHPKGLPSLELIQDCSTIAVAIVSREQSFGSDLESHVLLDLTLFK